MNTTVLLGCGKSKRAKPWRGPIVDLYTGNLFQARLAVARKMGGPDWVLSAFFGTCRPDFEAFSYDRTLGDRDVQRWYSGAVETAMRCYTAPGDRIVVLASKPYWQGWACRLRTAGRVVATPLEGLSIGHQLQWLKEELGRGE